MNLYITDEMVEAATMTLLGKTKDPVPGIDWWASRQWRVNKVREKMRRALEVALLAQGPYVRALGIPPGYAETVDEAARVEEHNASLNKGAAINAREQCGTCGASEPFTGSCGTSDADTRALCKRALRQEGPSSSAKEPKLLLPKDEQQAVLDDPTAIACLINYHDVKECEADAFAPGSGTYHMKRAHELLNIGRLVILKDPEIWPDSLKAEFLPRRREP